MSSESHPVISHQHVPVPVKYWQISQDIYLVLHSLLKFLSSYFYKMFLSAPHSAFC